MLESISAETMSLSEKVSALKDSRESAGNTEGKYKFCIIRFLDTLYTRLISISSLSTVVIALNVAAYNIGNKTKQETTIGAKSALVQRIIISNTAIVGSDLSKENIGAMNFPNDGRTQAITQSPQARIIDTKKANRALKNVAKHPLQKEIWPKGDVAKQFKASFDRL